jgi:hypothetical protein
MLNRPKAYIHTGFGIITKSFMPCQIDGSSNTPCCDHTHLYDPCLHWPANVLRFASSPNSRLHSNLGLRLYPSRFYRVNQAQPMLFSSMTRVRSSPGLDLSKRYMFEASWQPFLVITSALLRPRKISPRSTTI